MIHSINVADITKAVVQSLTEDLAIGGAGAQVERSENFETPDGVKGYVGVYRDRVTFTPRTLGNGSGYRQQNTSLVVLMRESGYDSGEKCEDALEELVANVMRVILSDETLRGTVDVLDNIEVRYDKYDQEGGLYTQTAGLFFTAIATVRKT